MWPLDQLYETQIKFTNIRIYLNNIRKYQLDYCKIQHFRTLIENFSPKIAPFDFKYKGADLTKQEKTWLTSIRDKLSYITAAQSSNVFSSYCSPFFDCSICFSMIAFTCANETGVKSVLSTPTSYCVGRSILSRGASFPVLFLLVCTCPKSCQVSSYEPP